MDQIMYLRQTLSGVATAFFLITLLFIFFFYNDPAIQPLLEEKEEVPFRQQRLFVTKDVIYTDSEGQRMQTRVRGRRGLLFIEKQERDMFFNEVMYGVKGFIQEKLFDGPAQNVSLFEADEAEYDHRTGRVEASGVNIYKLVMPGHALPENIKEGMGLMEASCREASFSLLDKSVRFSAKGFHAHYKGDKKL